MRSIKFTASNGSSITFDSSGSEYFITSLEGIDTPTVDSQTQKAPYQDGVTNIDQIFEARDITLEGIIKTPVDLTAINTNRRIMQSVLNPKLGPGTILYTYDSGSKTIQAKCIACTFANRNMPTPFQTFQIQFECADPYWQSTTTDATSVGLVSALTKFPIKFDFQNPLLTFMGPTFYGLLGTSDFTMDQSGNIWATENGSGIYKCSNGGSLFSIVHAELITWSKIINDSSGNIWALAPYTDIYICSVGSNTFTPLGAGAYAWADITSDPTGNIWVSADSGPDIGIYKCLAGATTFTKIAGGEAGASSSITSDPFGNIWTNSGCKCNYGSTTFTSFGFSSDNITSDTLGNIYATTQAGDLYRCGVGSVIFSIVVRGQIQFNSIMSDLMNNIWCTPSGGDLCVYNYRYNAMVGFGLGFIYGYALGVDSIGNVLIPTSSGFYECLSTNIVFNYMTVFSEVSSVSSRLITNNGDVPEPIIATLYGPAVNPTLINQTTGEFIHLIYTLNIGESIVINTTFGTKTITLNTGGNTTNGLQYLDPQSTFFQLQAGNNTMNIYDDTGSAQLRCDIGKVDRFIGI